MTAPYVIRNRQGCTGCGGGSTGDLCVCNGIIPASTKLTGPDGFGHTISPTYVWMNPGPTTVGGIAYTFNDGPMPPGWYDLTSPVGGAGSPLKTAGFITCNSSQLLFNEYQQFNFNNTDVGTHNITSTLRGHLSFRIGTGTCPGTCSPLLVVNDTGSGCGAFTWSP